MADKKLQRAQAAVEALHEHTRSARRAGVRSETPKYKRLNAEADKAVRALPVGQRSRFTVGR